jgi:hypothetical protein
VVAVLGRSAATRRLAPTQHATWQAPTVRAPTAVDFLATRAGAHGVDFHYPFCLTPG